MNHEFYKQETLDLSKNLLGAELIYNTGHGTTAGIIVETEAYKGPEDRAAHSFGGRRTERTEVMYGPPGHAYLYMIYGMHVCFNVVSGPVDKPEAVLIRALEPTQGIEQMMENRAIDIQRDAAGNWKINRLKSLTNGPAKLVKALGLSRDLYGHDLTLPPLYIKPSDRPIPRSEMAEGPRIGIENTGEARDYPWRFWIKANPFVSKQR